MTTDFETPAEADDERPVVDEPAEDAPVLPEHLDIPVDLPEADALDQAQEVPLDDEEYEA
jgi:hypothetical protein